MSSLSRGFDPENPWQRRRTFDSEIDMTAMIDCTFLLLVFFMVCSTMQSQPDLDLPVAIHSQGVETQSGTIITILAGTLQTGPTLLLGDGNGDEAALDEIRGYVSEAVLAGRSQIIVKCEGDVSHGFLEDVLQQIVAVEGAKLYVAVGDAPEQ